MLPGDGRWWTNPESDESFLQFRERSIRDGVWLSLVVILIVFVYGSSPGGAGTAC